MRGLLLPALLAVTAMVDVGCSSETTIQGSGGGAASAGSSGSGAGGTSGSAGSGGSVTDGPGPEAEADASSGDGEAEAAVPTGCAKYPQAAFCADFDSVATVAQGWESTDLMPSGSSTVDFDNTTYVSPPRSARSAIPAGSKPVSMLRKLVAATSNHVALDLDFRYEPFSTTELVYFFALANNAASTPYVGLTIQGGTWKATVTNYSAADGGFATNYFPLSVTPAPGQWTHIRLEVAFTANGSVKCLIDGKTAVDVPTTAVNGPTLQDIAVYVGIKAGTGSTPSIVTFADDVALTFLSPK